MWNIVLGETVIQAANLEKDCNSFTVCVAIGMFVLGLWGISLPSSFLSGTGLFPQQCMDCRVRFLFVWGIIVFCLTMRMKSGADYFPLFVDYWEWEWMEDADDYMWTLSLSFKVSKFN